MSVYQNIRISVIGDVMIDNFVYTRVIKPSSEAPVLIVRKSAINNILGGAANVANNLKELGLQCQLCGIRGNDYFGSKMSKLLKERQISDSILIDNRRPTTVKTRYVAVNQQLLRVDTELETRIPDSATAAIFHEVKEFNPDVIVISDYNKGVITPKLIDSLKSLDKKIIVNPKPQNILAYQGVDTVQLNKAEAYQCLKIMKANEADYGEILKRLQLECLLVTRGAEGIWIYTKEGVQKIDAVAEKVVDPCGCGDTVMAVVAVERYLGTDIGKVGILANDAAASVIRKLGTHVVDKPRLLNIRKNILK